MLDRGSSDLPLKLKSLLSWLALAVALAGLLFAAAAAGLRYGLVPRIPGYKPQIEAQLSQATGLPVRIAVLESGWTGWNPVLKARGISIRDRQGQEALSFEAVTAELSWDTLLRGLPVFESLDLGSPRLVVRRLADGRFRVAGLDLDPNAAGDSPLDDWLVEQHRVRITGAEVEWIDELRGAPPARLAQVSLTLLNHGLKHEFSLGGQVSTDASPVAMPLAARGEFAHPLLTRDKTDYARWRGQLFVSLEQAQLATVRRYVDLPFDLSAGAGSVRGWLDIDRLSVQQATADVALADVRVRLARKQPELDLQRLSGRLIARFDKPGIALEARQLSWQRAGKPQQAPADLKFHYYSPEDAKLAGGDLSASRLDLGEVRELISTLPLPAGLRAALDRHQPQGVLSGLAASWKGFVEAPREYQLRTQFDQLALAAVPFDDKAGAAAAPAAARGTEPAPPASLHPGIPGAKGLSGRIDANQSRGSAELVINKGSLTFPGVFDEPTIELDRLNARLSWVRQDDWRVSVDSLEFANAHAAGSARAQWRPVAARKDGHASPGYLDLQGQLTRADATRVTRYLPLGIPAPVRSYLQNAITAGRAKAVDFAVKGDLYDFPFGDGGGDFRIAAQLEDAAMNYVPGEDGRPLWPAFTGIQGQIVFDRVGMQVKDVSAKVFGVSLAKVNGGIADMRRNAALQLSGQTQGPLDDYLKYLQQTPINRWSGHVLEVARGTGNARLDLQLTLPLANLSQAKVDGTVALAGNDVTLSPQVPAFSRATGTVRFNEHGFTVRPMKAQFLGGELTLDGGTRPDGSTLLNAAGTFTAEGLRRETALGLLATLAGRASGSARYDGVLQVRAGQPELAITTNLQGLALSLPPPLAKTAEQPLAVRYANTVTQGSAQAPETLRDQLNITVGNVLSAAYERQLELAAQGPQWKVLRGGIGINGPAVVPDAGVFANVRLPRIDLDAWSHALRDMPDGAADAAGGGYAPTMLAFVADEMILWKKPLQNVVVGATLLDGQWQANVEARQLSGYIAWRVARGGASLGRVTARLARLTIPKDSEQDVEALLDEPPEALPAFDVIVDDLELHGKRLGRFELDATNRNVQGVREWRIARLTLTNPESTLAASGNWVPVTVLRPAGGAAARVARRMSMDFKLDVADAGGLLRRYGLPDAVRGGSGTIEGPIAWIGSPFSLDLPSLSGQLAMKMGKGQFLRVDPGIAKLLGVLSLQSLPRRIGLDFRDVFSEGFAFDEVTANVSIASGVAKTNNFRMKGVQANVLLEGEADIGRETQNLYVVVEPDVNLGAASLAYTAINPAIGLTTLVLQALARNPLRKAFAYEYRITGSWADPKVDKVERKPAEGTGRAPAEGPATAQAHGKESP